MGPVTDNLEQNGLTDSVSGWCTLNASLDTTQSTYQEFVRLYDKTGLQAALIQLTIVLLFLMESLLLHKLHLHHSMNGFIHVTKPLAATCTPR